MLSAMLRADSEEALLSQEKARTLWLQKKIILEEVCKKGETRVLSTFSLRRGREVATLIVSLLRIVRVRHQSILRW